MAEPPPVIAYETPTPPAKGLNPIVWWFVFAGLMLFASIFIAMVVHHDRRPDDPPPPPEVELTMNLLLWASLALFVVLSARVVLSKLRRRLG